MEFSLLLLALLVNLVFITYFFFKLNNLLSDVKELTSLPPVEDVKQHLSTYELERLEREEEFDQRINRLKEEIALQQKVISRGVVADELHPLVRNLPHDVIDTRRNVLPDVEVSE